MSELLGADGVARCSWGNSTPDYVDYHDKEWGTPLHGQDELYERLCLESFQSGLSWITILRKREGFRKAFKQFKPAKVAKFGDADVERLMQDASIVRNRAKILAAINNAKAIAALDDAAGRPAVVVRACVARAARSRWRTSRRSRTSPRRWPRS